MSKYCFFFSSEALVMDTKTCIGLMKKYGAVDVRKFHAHVLTGRRLLSSAARPPRPLRANTKLTPGNLHRFMALHFPAAPPRARSSLQTWADVKTSDKSRLSILSQRRPFATV